MFDQVDLTSSIDFHLSWRGGGGGYALILIGGGI